MRRLLRAAWLVTTGHGLASSKNEATSAAMAKLRELYKQGKLAEASALELEHPTAAIQAAVELRASEESDPYERWKWSKLGEADGQVLAAATALGRPQPETRGPDWWKPTAGAVAELGYWTLRGSTAAEGVLLEELRAREADDWVAREIDAALRKAWATPSRVDVSHAMDIARAALVAGDAQRALETYNTVTDLEPDWPEGWRRRGKLLDVALKRRDEAARALATAADLNPRNYVVLLDLGALLLHMRRTADAKATLREAAALNPALQSHDLLKQAELEA